MTDIIEAARNRKFPRFFEEFLQSVENPDIIEITLQLAFVEGAKWALSHENKTKLPEKNT